MLLLLFLPQEEDPPKVVIDGNPDARVCTEVVPGGEIRSTPVNTLDQDHAVVMAMRITVVQVELGQTTPPYGDEVVRGLIGKYPRTYLFQASTQSILFTGEEQGSVIEIGNAFQEDPMKFRSA